MSESGISGASLPALFECRNGPHVRGYAVVLIVGGIGLFAMAACRSTAAGAEAGMGAEAGAEAGMGAGAGAEAGAGAGAGVGAGAGAGSGEARRAMGAARVPGIGFAAVAREREVGVGGVGLADATQGVVASGETVFEAASIAKVVVATCVMQMVEDGTLDLDADVGKYVGFAVRHPRWPDAITLRLLLVHRSSIRDRQDEISAGAAGNPLGSFLKKYLATGGMRAAPFFDARPGSSAAYSNVGAALAAFVVERVAGESFADVSARRVFVPLRMASTSWTAPSRTSVAVATPHAYRDGGFVALPQPSHAVYPAVDLRSSAHDLARFVRAVLRDGELEGARILSAGSVRTMLQGDGDQALAWQLRTIRGARVAGHEGEDVGATSALFLDVAAGTGAVVLANGDAFGSGDGARAAAIQGLLGDLLAVAGTR